MKPQKDNFRDHLPNADQQGARTWLYPRAEKGRLLRWRTAVAWILLAALFAGPFLSIDGHPLFLFNVLERRFIFFGVPFWPQDFYLVAIGLITFIVFIALFTVIYGRVWCGWACPQTIFMEMVFRKIEVWIEGDHNARKRLDAAPWTGEKILKKTAKHTVFFLLSFVISNLFLAYLIGKNELFAIMTDNVSGHVAGLASILGFTGLFYLVFARLREIVCTTICPYGRLQGVLLDKHSLVVAYDYVRGEPRGKIVRQNLSRGQQDDLPQPFNASGLPSATKGDCIDCLLCVQVCPMGIDIRNGSQLECINCTSCIDACNNVMDKIHRPQGLIRIDSHEGIEQKKPLRFTGRMKAYSAVLTALIGVLVYLLVSRPDVQTTVLRAPGQLFQREKEGEISNLYTIEIINKTYHNLPVSFRIKYPHARIHLVQAIRQVPSNEMAKGVFFIRIPENAIRQNSTKLTVEVLSKNEVIDRVQTTFLGPGPF
ncbi:cytochrome c oxidase accessory protein CcoG [Larkinella rosea]|uniref:Cytochrome c oxidase accessory protein CcoG n=1 Tax=Larkinella rosea TaxID=2025312 RepID=A0A3P1C164_9BACT|nr:cytochrome c oxidase accessory protein CcoG [Larkinella rosea]RRB06988.1 cytochrome c oxidase accessory protein CcoG [Larkinella rosea]